MAEMLQTVLGLTLVVFMPAADLLRRRSVLLHLAAAVVLLSASTSPAATQPKQVLVLHSFGLGVEPFRTAAAAFRETLAREWGEPISLHEMPLDLPGSDDAEAQEAFATFLERRLAGRPPDLVVPVGSSAVRFVAKHRNRLFPDAPVLLLLVDPRLVDPALLRSNATLVTQKLNLPGLVEDMLQLRPDTANIAVVLGSSPIERFWEGEMRREFQTFAGRVSFTWLTGMGLSDVTARCSSLPPRSFILLGLFALDATGIASDYDTALSRIRERTNAPIFGYFKGALGKGIVGGRLYQDAEVGVWGARVASRILRGERAGDIAPQVTEPVDRLYDARELQRWGIPESVLPSGSAVLYREPGPWERYRWRIVAIGLFFLLQTSLIVGLLISRSARRKSEEALRAGSERISAAIDIAGLGFYEMGAAQRVTFLDDRIRSVLGIPPEEEARGRSFWLEHVHADDLPEVQRGMRQMIDGGIDRFEVEYRYAHPAHGLRWIHHLSRVLERNAAGGALKLVGVVRDVTEEQRIRQSAARLRDEIAHLARVTAMGEMAATLAHELNQPLAAIMNNAGAARRMIEAGTTENPEDVRETVDDIVADAGRAGEIVRRVRGLVKREAPVLGPVDLNDIVDEVLRLAYADIAGSGISVQLELAPELPQVRSDRIQLQQVLLNLLVNAVDALKPVPGERVLTVRTKAAPGGGVQVIVEDTGPGIPADELDSVFRPFHSTKPGGLGMGLAICRTILAGLGGSIRADAVPGRGARLRFVVPAAPEGEA